MDDGTDRGDRREFDRQYRPAVSRRYHREFDRQYRREADRQYRREVVATLAAGIAAGVAGCVSDGRETSADEGDDVHDGDDVHGVPSVDDHPVDDPLDPETGDLCAICRMPVVDYPEWNGQLAHADGTGVFVCTPGCLFGYYGAVETAGASEAPIERAWTTAYETTDRIDAEAAFFALEREGDGADEPMHPNPRPFPDEDAATAFVAEDADLDESDVVELAAVDGDLAEFYRGERI